MDKSIKSVIDCYGQNTLISIESHIASGLPTITIIGYAGKTVDEARERIRAGMANSSIDLPKKKIIINLAPADLPKDDTSLDVSIVVSLLASSGQVNGDFSETIFLGEIGLDGSLKPVRGLIGKVMDARNQGYSTFYIPFQNMRQAELLADNSLQIKLVRNLRDLYLDLTDTLPLGWLETAPNHHQANVLSTQYHPEIDLNEIIGQRTAKRALEIAAAGKHNILMNGPPGTGKSMLSKALPGILPELKYQEMLAVTQLHSLSTGQEAEAVVKTRPFRAPHHSASSIAIVGGGQKPKPGEISLADKGILFLDELPEFRKDVLEALRQPLEDKIVRISRAKGSTQYPADFMLVATQNPCPCGYYGTNKPCSCSITAIQRYQQKISGPIADRIDIHIDVSEVEHDKLLSKTTHEEASSTVRERVTKAWQVQAQRLGEGRFNASISSKILKNHLNITPEARQLLDTASSKLDLSARSYMKVIRIAQTIADLEDSPQILTPHIAEALQYRPKRQNY